MNPRLLDQCRNYLLANANITTQSEPAPPPRAVTISRETGAGAVTIGELVIDYLQRERVGDPRKPWALFDRNLVKRVLTDHRMPEAIEQYMPEDAARRVADLFEDLLGVHPPAWTLTKQTTQTILRLAKNGNVILVGRGGNVVTEKLKHVLHVRLIAPLDIRIQRVGEFYHLTPKKAADFIRKNDLARARYIRRNFKAGINDPLRYHLTINTGAVDCAVAARLIGEAVAAITDD